MNRENKSFPVTVQMIVKNEDRFVWYALNSVKGLIKNFIIFDTGSDDRTVAIVQHFITDNPQLEITYEQITITKPEDISSLRQKQLELTKTPWFLLLDGDEVWRDDQLFKILQLIKQAPKQTIAVVNQTKNCVGDVWHYLPEFFGKYRFLGKTGHLNIRLMKTLPYTVKGSYPNEGYYLNGHLVNTCNENLMYSDAWYLHTTHLRRSSMEKSITFGRRKPIYTKGIKIFQEDLPEVLYEKTPQAVEHVRQRRSQVYETVAYLADCFRTVKTKVKQL